MPIVGRDSEEAARRLMRGETVAFPTETVYGLGAAAANAEAVAAMYELKNRPKNHPCIVHLHSFSDAKQWAEVPQAAQKLAAAFMPGALTLLLRAKPAAKNVARGETIALRVPSHPLARALLKKVGEGIAAPSANRFGKISPTNAAHVFSEFADAESLYILDGGSCEVGLESAIVSCLDGRVAVVRPGVISAAQISEAAQTPLSPPPVVAAPGNLRNHYAPQKPFFILPPDSFAAKNAEQFLQQFSQTAINSQTAKLFLQQFPANATNEKSAELSLQQFPAHAKLFLQKCAVLSRVRPPAISPELWRCAAKDPREYARDLYAFLRELDATAADCIIAELPPAKPEWTAIRDRLLKAAGKNDNPPPS